jgi:glycogen phosphorylase/synthase
MNEKTEELKYLPKPDCIFEVSCEVCNKIGGIYTVITTKTPELLGRMERSDQLIMIGPDVWKETTDHPHFEEDLLLFKSWREYAARDGLYFRIGRWKTEGRPLAILVDFTSFFARKDEVFAHFWEKFGLDSISGQWDYIEPAMFGYAAARVIESYYRTYLSPRDRVVAQFHEWMTGTGVLYLKENTPGIATVFTTHATVLGRSLAGNGRALYSTMAAVIPDQVASEFQVKSKYSLEKLAAQHCDVFTTVSEITSEECQQLIKKKTDLVTPNGFDQRMTPPESDRASMRAVSRKRILKVAESLFDESFGDDTLLVLTSGRYEFRNKGLDVFIDAISELGAGYKGDRRVVAIIAVPAYHHGPRHDLKQRLEGESVHLSHAHHALTHLLNNPENDPILQRIDQRKMGNKAGDKVFLCFSPTYLTGDDGIFNLDYYSFLSGFDLTLFPSYYEPWGYTPLESIAYGIPSATTTLAGFGRWIQSLNLNDYASVRVVSRSDNPDTDLISGLTSFISEILQLSAAEYQKYSQQALDIASMATWHTFLDRYMEGYGLALNLASAREPDTAYASTNGSRRHLSKEKESPVWSKILVKSSYPPALDKLKKLTDNLWWTWNHQAAELFRSIDPGLWKESGNNPVKLLSMLSYEKLKGLVKDETFMLRLEEIYRDFTNYISVPAEEGLPEVAYFSMEFGLHESLKIYSGGLGILAGDFIKEASDDNKKITGVGLLYRYGYFTQKITPYGNQEAAFYPQKFSDLPIHPVRNEQGDWLTVSIAFPGRNLYAKIWRVDVGRVKLYLLDADTEKNSPQDRVITHQLYGGDKENRFKQEMLLGVGGIRLLETLGLEPDLYHCNEGHAAFLNFERIRDLVQKRYLSFAEALEVVRSSTLFTTHTPVPAGHDTFPEELLRAYLAHYPERYHISWDELMALGKENPEDPAENFSMSVLAISTAQEVNGVSALHGEVSRAMFQPMFHGYFTDELHIGHVTNGVHYPTWTHAQWQSVHQRFISEKDFGNQHIAEDWKGIDEVSDIEIWNTRNALKRELLSHLAWRIKAEMTARQESPGHIVRVIESLEQPWLTIGFARRFATYKRAHLLFTNEERLSQLINNRKRPLRFIFAGKAHPVDKAGQDLIKRIVEISRKPAFEGKILFVENYDMELGRYLTQGCDVWLNNPTRPQEASGTSGEKAVMNGVLNLSVLDGWWAEGYKPEAGWALPMENTYLDSSMQDQLDAESIYNIMEEKIAPLYYDRNGGSVPSGWIRYIRNNFKLITPHFTMKRMMREYHDKYYYKLKDRHRLMLSENFRNARSLAGWKRRVLIHWDDIVLVDRQIPDSTVAPLNLGEEFKASVTIQAPGLGPDDLGIEVIFGEKVRDVVQKVFYKEMMQVTVLGDNTLRFDCAVLTRKAGVFDYAFRLFPNHPLLAYRMDFPIVKWL